MRHHCVTQSATCSAVLSANHSAARSAAHSATRSATRSLPRARSRGIEARKPPFVLPVLHAPPSFPQTGVALCGSSGVKFTTGFSSRFGRSSSEIPRPGPYQGPRLESGPTFGSGSRLGSHHAAWLGSGLVRRSNSTGLGGRLGSSHGCDSSGGQVGGERGRRSAGKANVRITRDVRAAVGVEIGSSAAQDVIGTLGLDTLTFLVATVIVIPFFRSFNASPILGFLLSGAALNQLGLISSSAFCCLNTHPLLPSHPPIHPSILPSSPLHQILGFMLSGVALNQLGLIPSSALRRLNKTPPFHCGSLLSPSCRQILGFLLSGVALNQLGLIRNISDVKALSELGILFLLFEMGLELSIERLRALAKFAFGMGLPQVLLTTLAFAAFELPPDNAMGTRLLEWAASARPDLVNIRSVDEAIVIGAALSLSSSAFVLQLLSEKGELATRVGSATLGILLLQDIAVVPLLVILPILESGSIPPVGSSRPQVPAGLGVLLYMGRLFPFLYTPTNTLPSPSPCVSPQDFTDDSLFPLLAAAGLKSLLGLGDFTDDSLFPLLAAAGLKSLLGLGVLLYMGRLFLRRFFEFVAESRSTEAFVALCLLTVTGTSLITSKLGFSDSYFLEESRSTEAFVALCHLTVTGTSLITSKLGFRDSLGAFLAGALLAETNYRTQVEADIRPFRGLLLGLFFVEADIRPFRGLLLGLFFVEADIRPFRGLLLGLFFVEADIRPFRGLLLGLFFVTTGTSIDLSLLAAEWPNILLLLSGLIAIKTAIITALGPRVGLSLPESIRTGLLLSQGGEFAFVVFALASQLGVLPDELNRLLIIVVVLSMALTPLLDSLGRSAAEALEKRERERRKALGEGEEGDG
ncbi:unnamed protein product [Closterium sp. Naga37s-1]|nr:unnamed protein product [Closterium sp. Naga37s-1]